MKKLQKVEMNFDIFFDKKITLTLNKKDSKCLIEYLKQGMKCLVFFPNYEEK